MFRDAGGVTMYGSGNTGEILNLSVGGNLTIKGTISTDVSIISNDIRIGGTVIMPMILYKEIMEYHSSQFTVRPGGSKRETFDSLGALSTTLIERNGIIYTYYQGY